jgi:antitoxin ParD1/3/4
MANFAIKNYAHTLGADMPTRNVSLPKELDAFVEASVQSGHYANASEVIREALRELRQAELEDKARIEALRTAISEGLEGPFRDGPTVMAEMRERIRSRAKAHHPRSRTA